MKSYDLRQPQKSLVVLSIICIRINQIFKQTFSRFFRTNTLQNRNRTSRVIKTAPSEDSQSSWNKCMNPRFYISLWKYTWILENCPRLVNNISKRKEKRGNTIISTLSFYLTSSFEDFFLSAKAFRCTNLFSSPGFCLAMSENKLKTWISGRKPSP